MLLAMESWGFFAFCTAVSLLSLFFVWFFVPELSGRSLESTDALFSLPWWQIGRHGARLSPDTDPLSGSGLEKAEVEENEVQPRYYGRSPV